MLKCINKYLVLFLVFIFLGGCAGAIVGGVATVGLATVQERSVKDAAIDLKLELQLQEELFRSNTEKLFVNVSICIYSYFMWKKRRSRI